jgi:hypothetical protein
MNAEWEKLGADLARMKQNAAALRERCSELSSAEIGKLLAPLRGCMVELIALRSSLEKVKAEHGDGNGTV